MCLQTKIHHQRGETIMSQGVLSFNYEEEKSKAGMTALGGLPVYMDMTHVMGLSRSTSEHIGIRRGRQGWTDAQMVTALIMLNRSLSA